MSYSPMKPSGNNTAHSLSCLNSYNIHVIKNAYHMFTFCKSLPVKSELLESKDPVNHLFFFFLYIQHWAWILGKNGLQSLSPGDMGAIMLRANMKSWKVVGKVGPASRLMCQRPQSMLNLNLGDGNTQAQRQVSLTGKRHSSLGKSQSVPSPFYPLSSLTCLKNLQKSFLNPLAGFYWHPQISYSYSIYPCVFTHSMSKCC